MESIMWGIEREVSALRSVGVEPGILKAIPHNYIREEKIGDTLGQIYIVVSSFLASLNERLGRTSATAEGHGF